jgi:hypothetical protein
MTERTDADDVLNLADAFCECEPGMPGCYVCALVSEVKRLRSAQEPKSEDSVLGGKAISTRSRPPEGVGASATHEPKPVASKEMLDGLMVMLQLAKQDEHDPDGSPCSLTAEEATVLWTEIERLQQSEAHWKLEFETIAKAINERASHEPRPDLVHDLAKYDREGLERLALTQYDDCERLMAEVTRLREKLQPAPPFVVRHYAEDERPMIKGNGFDGLEIGEDREEAEAFISWINARLAPPPDADPLSGMTSVQALEYLADEFCTGVDVKINATLFKAGVNLGTVLRAMRRHANFPAGTASTQQVQHECLCSDGYCLVSRGGTTSAQCREELRAASTKSAEQS